MQVWHLKFDIMPSQRKRIGFLPSEEVHNIIEKLCKANEFSQSKVTGILVEEALRSRGELSEPLSKKSNEILNFISESYGDDLLSKSDKSVSNIDFYTLNKKSLTEDIKMMHEFIEFKYFKRIMKQNKNIFEKEVWHSLVFILLGFFNVGIKVYYLWTISKKC